MMSRLQLAVSETKTKMLYLGKGNSKWSYFLTDGTRIQSDVVIRDLGVYMDENLTFKFHVEQLVKKAKGPLFQIFKVFNHQTPSVLTLLYTTYVRSKLEYASVIWNPHRKGLIEEIEQIQHIFTRIVYYKCMHVRRRELPSYSVRCNVLSLETLAHRRKHAGASYLLKILSGDCKVKFGELFLLRHTAGRTTNFAIVNHVGRNDSFRHCFVQLCSSWLEKLPFDILVKCRQANWKDFLKTKEGKSVVAYFGDIISTNKIILA
jgi:hypothetical protein